MARMAKQSIVPVIVYGSAVFIFVIVSYSTVTAADTPVGIKKVEQAPVPAAAASQKKASTPGGTTFQQLKEKYNIADDVSEDYPIVFNIILFISISLVLALIAICVAIATMDPGRDSLIYRVTSSQRYKKDN